MDYLKQGTQLSSPAPPALPMQPSPLQRGKKFITNMITIFPQATEQKRLKIYFDSLINRKK